MCLRHRTICCRHFCHLIYEQHRPVPWLNVTKIQFFCVQASTQQVPSRSLFHFKVPFITELRFSFSRCFGLEKRPTPPKYSVKTQPLCWSTQATQYPRFSKNYSISMNSIARSFAICCLFSKNITMQTREKNNTLLIWMIEWRMKTVYCFDDIKCFWKFSLKITHNSTNEDRTLIEIAPNYLHLVFKNASTWTLKRTNWQCH